MALKLLRRLGIESVYVAGADGYTDGKKNYYKSSLKSSRGCDKNYNLSVNSAIKKSAYK